MGAVPSYFTFYGFDNPLNMLCIAYTHVCKVKVYKNVYAKSIVFTI